MFRKKKKVLFFSLSGWSSTGEAAEYSVTLGVAFTGDLLWGRGMNSPESQVGPIPKSDSSTPKVGGDPAQEQYESTANPSWDMQGWKRSGAAFWKMHFPNIFAVLGDGDVQSLPGFTWDSRGWRSGAVGTHKHIVGCIAPCCIRENLDLLAFFFASRPEEV